MCCVCCSDTWSLLFRRRILATFGVRTREHAKGSVRNQKWEGSIWISFSLHFLPEFGELLNTVQFLNNIPHLLCRKGYLRNGWQSREHFGKECVLQNGVLRSLKVKDFILCRNAPCLWRWCVPVHLQSAHGYCPLTWKGEMEITQIERLWGEQRTSLTEPVLSSVHKCERWN